MLAAHVLACPATRALLVLQCGTQRSEWSSHNVGIASPQPRLLWPQAISSLLNNSQGHQQLCELSTIVRVTTNCASYHQLFESSPTVRVIINCASYHQLCQLPPTVRVSTNCASHHQLCVFEHSTLARDLEHVDKMSFLALAKETHGLLSMLSLLLQTKQYGFIPNWADYCSEVPGRQVGLYLGKTTLHHY